MNPFELLEEVRRRPFRPFRINLTDGQTYEVHHPELCMPVTDAVIIGVTTGPDEFLFDRSVRIALSQVLNLKPITPAA